MNRQSGKPEANDRDGERERFVAAARRAQLQLEREENRPAPVRAAGAGWRLALTGALGLGVLLLAVWQVRSPEAPLPGLVRRVITPAIADEYQGIQCSVLNTASQRMLQGVEVREQDGAGQEGDGRLVAVTDASGSFTLPSPAARESRSYGLFWRGRKFSQLVTGDAPGAVRGMRQIAASIPLNEVRRVMEVQLEPGTEFEAWPGVRLSLDASAAGSWNGSLSWDASWPLEFQYGRVLEGIFVLEGPHQAGLTLSARLNPERLRLLRGNAHEAELIQHSDEYALLGDWQRSFHHGWFVTTRPLFGFDPTATPRQEARGSADWLSWEPEIGAPYAIMLPPARDGQLAGVIVDAGEAYGSESQQSAGFGLIDLESPQRYVYRRTYRTKGTTNRWSWPPYPNVYLHMLNMEGEGCPAEFYNGELANSKGQHLDPSLRAVPEVLGVGERRRVPGECTLIRDDFTLANAVEYGPLSPDYSIPVGDFGISIGKASLGKLAHCTVSGPLNRLKRSVQWDFNGDGVYDAHGAEADLLISAPGPYRICATLYDKNGSILQLSRALNVAPKAVAGYIPDPLLADTPVLEGLQAAPLKESSLPFASRTSVRSIAGLGWHGGTSSPLVRLAPPPEFRDVELKGMRIVMYCSPRNPQTVTGNVRSGFLSPFVTQLLEPPGERQGHLETSTEARVNGLDYGLTPGSSMSHIVGTALRAHLHDPERGALVTVMAHKENESHLERFSMVTGIDLRKPLTEEELVRRLQAFRDSPAYCLVSPERERQRCEMWVDLKGWKLPAGSQGLLCGVLLETKNVLISGQYEFYSGGSVASHAELETSDGRTFRRYFDFSPLE